MARRNAGAGAIDFEPPPVHRFLGLFILLLLLRAPGLHADCLVRASDGRVFRGKAVITQNGIRLHRTGAPDLFFHHEQVARILTDKACAPSSDVQERVPEPAKTPRPLKKVSYKGRPIDLDVQQARLQDVLMVLAETGGLSYIFTLPFDEPVTLHVKKVPWDQLLDLLARMYRFSYQIKDHVLVIGPLKDP